MQVVKERKKRSEKLTKEEWSAFKKYVRGFDTKNDCELDLSTSRQVIDNVILKGKGAPETIEKIRANDKFITILEEIKSK